MVCNCSLAMSKACDNCPNNNYKKMKLNGELFYIEPMPIKERDLETLKKWLEPKTTKDFKL